MEGSTADKIDLLRADTFQPVSAQPQSFSEYLSKPHRSDDTRRSDNESMSLLDEEVWDWPVLLTRVLCFALLFAFIVFTIIGSTLTLFYMVIAAGILLILIIVLIGTFVDITSRLPSWVPTCCLRKKERNSFAEEKDDGIKKNDLRRLAFGFFK